MSGWRTGNTYDIMRLAIGCPMFAYLLYAGLNNTTKAGDHVTGTPSTRQASFRSELAEKADLDCSAGSEVS
jgi:hypothetical protein